VENISDGTGGGLCGRHAIFINYTVGGSMKYVVKIIREVEFEVLIDAPSQAEVIKMVLKTAYDYDDRDLKETKIVSIKPQENFHHTFN